MLVTGKKLRYDAATHKRGIEDEKGRNEVPCKRKRNREKRRTEDCATNRLKTSSWSSTGTISN